MKTLSSMFVGQIFTTPFSTLFPLSNFLSTQYGYKSVEAPSIPPTSATAVWRKVNLEVQYTLSQDELYWWRRNGHALALLLHNADYSSHSQYTILKFFVTAIIPNLGTGLDNGGKRWKSFMTDDNTPIELSWDWHTGSKKPTVRFSIEPVGVDAGTAVDPENRLATANFRQVLLNSLPDSNMEWYNYFHAQLNKPSITNGSVEGHPTSIFYAFDLTEQGITSKAYFFPGFRAKATSKTNLEVLTETIENAPHCTPDNLPGFQMFKNYALDPSHGRSFEMDMLATDLINPLDSRMKIYFRSRETSFASVRDAMTLGGRITSPDIEQGLNNLRKLWDALLGQEGAPEDSALPEVNHRTSGTLFNVEFRVGGKTPKVKIYIPVRHYAASDRKIITGLNEYLYGVNAQTEKTMPGYVSAMSTLFDRHAMGDSTGLHTYIGCSIQAGSALRMVSYVNPQEEKFAQQKPRSQHRVWNWA